MDCSICCKMFQRTTIASVGLYILALALYVETSSVIVPTTNGEVKGKIVKSKDGLETKQWLSIPFAEPPLNELRFKRPVPKKNWEGILDVSEIANTCYQNEDALGGILNLFYNGSLIGNSTLSEDCLYLSVTSPLNPPKDAAVLIFFFGGANTIGSITQPQFEATELAAKGDIIIVAMQYRLGAFGYLYSGDEQAPGNMGIYDQIEALKWVQNNIKNFGGDPNKVTLFGLASGAGSVGLFLTSPKFSSLYQQGILSSGVPNNVFWTHTKDLELQNFKNIAMYTGCSSEEHDTKKIFECLQSRPASLLSKVTFTGMFAPVKDDTIGIKDRWEVFNNFPDGNGKKIIIGGTTDEGSISSMMIYPNFVDNYEKKLLNESYFRNNINTFLTYLPEDFRELIIYNYMPWEDLDNSDAYREPLIRLVSDYIFDCDSEKFAEVAADKNWTVLRYLFGYSSTVLPEFFKTWPGVAHSFDVAYAFNHPYEKQTDEDEKVSDIMIEFLANFVKTGDPNSSGNLPKWSPFDTISRGYLNIENDATFVQYGRANKNCFLFSKYLPIMYAAQKSANSNKEKVDSEPEKQIDLSKLGPNKIITKTKVTQTTYFDSSFGEKIDFHNLILKSMDDSFSNVINNSSESKYPQLVSSITNTTTQFIRGNGSMTTQQDSITLSEILKN